MKALFIVCIVIYHISNCVGDDGKEPDLLYEDMFKCLTDKYSPSIYNFTFNASILPGDSHYQNIVTELNQTNACYDYSIISDYLKAVKSVSRRYSSKYTHPIQSTALQEAYTAAYGNARGYPKELVDYSVYIEKNYYIYCNDANVTPLTDDILTIVYIQLYKLAVIGGNYQPLLGDRDTYQVKS